MKKSKKFALLTGAVVGVTAIAAHVMKKKAEKTTYEADLIEPIEKRKMGFYEKYGKRILDIACATAAIVVFSPLYLGVAALVKLKLGSPVLFTQDRPGLIGKDGKETVFKMYKFRTMTDERDENGELLPDDVRLTKFGKWLRNTSLDELPEAFNILNGTMSVIGPRPQLVRDMTFMTKEQRARHTAKPGLSGLAQVNGRNGISWEEKLEWDRKYIQNVSFAGDVKIIFDTVKKAFIKQEGITQDDMATAEDFGDWLLRMGKVSSKEYMMNQNKAKMILNGDDENERIPNLVSIIMPSYNTAQYIEKTIKSVLNQTYTNWELIIVDDCSTDNTDDVVKNYLSDKRIKYLKNEQNSGAAVSRNRALREAKGQWISFLDSDDLWMPEKLEKQICFMKENGYNFSYTDYEEISAEGNMTGVFVTGPKKITRTGMYNYCWPGCLTVMYDATKVGLIQISDIKKNNDYAMWLKVCKKADCYLLDECLGQYRKGRVGSVSTHSIKTMIGWHYRLFHEAEKRSALVSAIFTLRNLFWGVLKKIRYVKG
ncbi:sugar transferase [Ruminococcus sp.]|uniref:sugar transferase n=1 Tax=Ruminococcus sp. TaxID=41978 RepID=UPI00338E0284